MITTTVFKNEDDGPAGDIVFRVDDGKEMLRLCANGDILVKGNFAANDIEIVDTFKEFVLNVKQTTRRNK